MLLRILTIIAAVLLSLFALDWFLPRSRQSPSRSWDIAPIIGFLGVVLLGLGFVEASRRLVVDAWGWGIAFGLLLSVCVALAILYRAHRELSANRGTGLRYWLRVVQTYGLVLLIALFGVMIAVRVIGALLEVFIASALGTLVIAIAMVVFVNGKFKIPNSKF